VGPGLISYQWMANCTRPISGATTPTLKIKSIGPLDSGTYCVVVSNSFGTVSSQPAVLRVLVQPKLAFLLQTQDGISLTFATINNLLYSVSFSDDLPATNWTLLPNASEQPGTGAPMTVHDSGATGTHRYYKIEVQ
jgi:hypothetical protein